MIETHGAFLEPVRDQFIDRPHLQDVTVVHDRQPVAQDFGFLHVVGRQQDRPALALERQHEVPERPAGGRIEAGGRFIEEDEFRLVHEGQGDGEPLALTARQVRGPRVPALAQLEGVDEFRRRSRVRVEAAEQVDDLGDGQFRVERRRSGG